jgi:hypothetical protein
MTSPTLLTLPRELRYEIYSYLTIPKPAAYSSGEAPPSRISHRPPPISLQLACRYLRSRDCDLFLQCGDRSPQPPASLPPHDEEDYEACLPTRRLARKIEVAWIWEVGIGGPLGRCPDYPDVEKVEKTIAGLQYTLDLLDAEAKNIDVLVVDVSDRCGDWIPFDVKKLMLSLFIGMKGKVRYVLGEVQTAEWNELELTMFLEKFTRKLNDEEAWTWGYEEGFKCI